MADGTREAARLRVQEQTDISRLLPEDTFIRADGLHSPSQEKAAALRDRILEHWEKRKYATIRENLGKYKRHHGPLVPELLDIQLRLPSREYIAKMRGVRRKARAAIKASEFEAAWEVLNPLPRRPSKPPPEEEELMASALASTRRLREAIPELWLNYIRDTINAITSSRSGRLDEAVTALAQLELVPLSSAKKSPISFELKAKIDDARLWLESRTYITYLKAQEDAARSSLDARQHAQAWELLANIKQPPSKIHPDLTQDSATASLALSTLRAEIPQLWLRSIRTAIAKACKGDLDSLRSARKALKALDDVPLDAEIRDRERTKLRARIHDRQSFLHSERYVEALKALVSEVSRACNAKQHKDAWTALTSPPTPLERLHPDLQGACGEVDAAIEELRRSVPEKWLEHVETCVSDCCSKGWQHLDSADNALHQLSSIPMDSNRRGVVEARLRAQIKSARVQHLIGLARQAFEDGDWSGTVQWCSKVFEYDAGNTEATHLGHMARCQRYSQDLETALCSARRHLQSGEYPDALRVIASIPKQPSVIAKEASAQVRAIECEVKQFETKAAQDWAIHIYNKVLVHCLDRKSNLAASQNELKQLKQVPIPQDEREALYEWLSNVASRAHVEQLYTKARTAHTLFANVSETPS